MLQKATNIVEHYIFEIGVEEGLYVPGYGVVGKVFSKQYGGDVSDVIETLYGRGTISVQTNIFTKNGILWRSMVNGCRSPTMYSNYQKKFLYVMILYLRVYYLNIYVRN